MIETLAGDTNLNWPDAFALVGVAVCVLIGWVVYCLRAKDL